MSTTFDGTFKLATAYFGGSGWVKQAQLLAFTRNLDLDVLNIQETHLLGNESNSSYWMASYFRSFFKPNEGDKGASIATIVKPSASLKALSFVEHIQVDYQR